MTRSIFDVPAGSAPHGRVAHVKSALGIRGSTTKWEEVTRHLSAYLYN